ncbi:hypothetical protein FCH28_23815 [Streptomyces piniterrae]|uniref:Uncharacterized protein n=1 Tax=Streptomyces piniterrae TaxID=2571125 RepID=A0A4U0NK49_9ACTN|nr:hypothetical protein [Streptomyces piniterrae]TJZ50314.1 hypothetical protein FCH28_23815 [Streptomyces piniterrae]
MPGEELHEVGADGARRAKEWLEATTRVKASWTNTDSKWIRRMTFKWPAGKQTTFSLDLGGLLCGGEFDNDIFMAECKKYASPGDQGTHYLSYLAKCYVIVSQQPTAAEHFMWITWCPFNVTDWDKLLTEHWVRKAIRVHANEIFGEIPPEEVEDAIDADIVTAVTERLWMIVLSEKQEKLVITREHRALIQRHDVLEGVR